MEPYNNSNNGSGDNNGMNERQSWEADRETLEGYILREYSQYAKPAGELTGAAQALDALLQENGS